MGVSQHTLFLNTFALPTCRRRIITSIGTLFRITAFKARRGSWQGRYHKTHLFFTAPLWFRVQNTKKPFAFSTFTPICQVPFHRIIRPIPRGNLGPELREHLLACRTCFSGQRPAAVNEVPTRYSLLFARARMSLTFPKTTDKILRPDSRF